jgi:hypothetical protein
LLTIQFAQNILKTCHSEAGFIGEESAFVIGDTADSSRDSAALGMTSF